MTERPIIFSGEMVRAILDGRKTETRRVIKPQPPDNVFSINHRRDRAIGEADFITWLDPYGYASCPYGKPGDKLWVREAWAYYPDGNNAIYKAREGKELTEQGVDLSGCWKSPNFMPKKFARLRLEITDVRVERLQDMKFKDFVAEGIPESNRNANAKAYAFKQLWDSLYAEKGYGWDKNPYVWVIEFKKGAE